MIPTTGRSTSGSRRGRCLLGMVAVTTTVLTGTGCGLFSNDGGGGSDGADRTDRADHGEELTPAEEALCTIGDALAVTDDATLTDVLTDDDPSTAGPLLAVGLFASLRIDQVRALGPYRAGALAIERRYVLRLDTIDERRPDDDTPLPDAEPTEEELASVRAADRFLAEGRCPPGEDE